MWVALAQFAGHTVFECTYNSLSFSLSYQVAFTYL